MCIAVGTVERNAAETSVGSAFGTVLGALEGTDAGEVVGPAVGTPVGLTLGDELGIVVETNTGWVVYSPVSTSVSSSPVRSAVSLGTALGSRVCTLHVGRCDSDSPLGGAKVGLTFAGKTEDGDVLGRDVVQHVGKHVGAAIGAVHNVSMCIDNIRSTVIGRNSVALCV